MWYEKKHRYQSPNWFWVINKIRKLKLMNKKKVNRSCIDLVFIITVIFTLVIAILLTFIVQLPTIFLYVSFLMTLVTLNIFVLAFRVALTLIYVFQSTTVASLPILKNQNIWMRRCNLWLSSHFFIQNTIIGKVYRDDTIRSRIGQWSYENFPQIW